MPIHECRLEYDATREILTFFLVVVVVVFVIVVIVVFRFVGRSGQVKLTTLFLVCSTNENE
jgi:hypothetical protein